MLGKKTTISIEDEETSLISSRRKLKKGESKMMAMDLGRFHYLDFWRLKGYHET